MQRAAIEPTAGARPGSAMDHFMRGGAVNPESPWGIPTGFDTEGFVANARVYFGKLQAAWQTGNLDQLSDFTTNDMFIALTHELRARGEAPKSIDIEAMETRLLGIESTPAEHLASVRFTGSIRVDGESEKVDEVWNLSKAADGKTGWLLAGIQQIA
jgi:predicted lipid-binding transport protein (Tim44 family)